MPRPLSAAAICRSVFAPAAWASRMAGATLSAKASAPAEWVALAIVWVAVWPQWGENRRWGRTGAMMPQGSASGRPLESQHPTIRLRNHDLRTAQNYVWTKDEATILAM